MARGAEPNCYPLTWMGVLKTGRVAKRRRPEKLDGKSGARLRKTSFVLAAEPALEAQCNF